MSKRERLSGVKPGKINITSILSEPSCYQEYTCMYTQMSKNIYCINLSDTTNISYMCYDQLAKTRVCIYLLSKNHN